MEEKVKLNLERPVAFYPQLARALGGISEAIFIQQLYYWSDKGKDKEGWIYKSKKEWEKETTLTPKQQDRIRRKLTMKKYPLIEVKLKKAKGSPTLFYKLDIGLLQKVINEYDQREESNLPKGNKPSTEITPEITPKDNTNASNEIPSLKEKEEAEEIQRKEEEKKRKRYKEEEKKKYGEFHNVLLTDAEFQKLKDKFNSQTDAHINKLSEYMNRKSTKYKDHYKTILKWEEQKKYKQLPAYKNLLPEEQKLFDTYVDGRRKQRLPNEIEVYQGLLEKYIEYGKNPQVIKDAIIGGYKNFFAVKDTNNLHGVNI